VCMILSRVLLISIAYLFTTQKTFLMAAGEKYIKGEENCQYIRIL